MAFFKIVRLNKTAPTAGHDSAYLIEDKWDDWAKYRTQFWLIVYDENGNRFEPGSVKIGEVNLLPSAAMSPGFRAPTLSDEFDELDNRHFSLGQGEQYYETLNQCTKKFREKVLEGLHDCAFNLVRFESLQSELVMNESLLREVAAENVRTRFHRLASGDATLTKFLFAFDLPTRNLAGHSVELTFKIEPHSNPPTNVHVLIGRNGVGKSRCMQSLARAIVSTGDRDGPDGAWRQIKEKVSNDVWATQDPDWRFAGVVFVSFSAFDSFKIHGIAALGTGSIRATVIGLRNPTTNGNADTSVAKSREELNQDFLNSFESCRRGLRAERLRAALLTLGSDPLFAEADMASYLDETSDKWMEGALEVFSDLSSGHAIILLTITRLVEVVDERTLVLFDEPEGHLHPPLLSAFIRCLADLLIKRNAVAIVATHSPVVLQEVPKSCVWKLRRSGTIVNAERPVIETFGENVGTLTTEVFGLEVVNAGFHKLIKDAVDNENLNYEQILQRFGGQMGAESRAIARALVSNKEAGGGSRA